MMDWVTIVCCILLPSIGFGKPLVTESSSFILRAPDNDTGIWMWKTANSKVSFQHFHHAGDAAGNGYWTLEVTHSETVPKHIQRVKELMHMETGRKRQQKERDVTPVSVVGNSFSKLPRILVLNTQETPADVFHEQKRATTIVLPTEEGKSSAELLEDFLRDIDATDVEVKQSQELKSQIKADINEDLEKPSTHSDAEQDDPEEDEVDEEEENVEEENWWLPGENLLDEEEDGYFHVRNIIRVKLYALRKDWEEARRKCRRDGGDLAVPDTVKKARVILKLLHHYPEIPASAVLRNQVYVGIHDPMHHRDWITVKGDGFTKDFWAPGEPDNESPGEDCVTFRTDGKIRDVPCFYSLPFVCEKPLPLSEEMD